jgi:hypothetical protein
MNKLQLSGLTLILALGACANDGLVGEQDEHEDGSAGDGDGDGDGDDEQNVPADCPEVPPVQAAPCSQEGASCDYDECIEPISMATCTDGHWLVELDGCPAPFEQTCPDSLPAEGDPCSPDAVSLGCTYDCASGLPADHGMEARCTDMGIFELNDDECRLCGGVANPAGCGEENPCTEGWDCVPPTDGQCISSGCSCDVNGHWSCLPDCGGHVCRATSVSCEGNNPAGCSDQNPCPDGKQCVPSLEPVCLSSFCSCDGQSATWDCSTDCDGGVCVAE